MKYCLYLRYVLRHKWFVFLECAKRGRYWAGLMHDMSKLYPSEFIPYANFFYGEKGSDINKGRDETGYYKPARSGDMAFDVAWLMHQHRNPHHWQFWVLQNDEDGRRILRMPERYVVEMVCDWKGAGRAQGTPDVLAWYDKHKGDMMLHFATRATVEALIGYGGIV